MTVATKCSDCVDPRRPRSSAPSYATYAPRTGVHGRKGWLLLRAVGPTSCHGPTPVRRVNESVVAWVAPKRLPDRRKVVMNDKCRPCTHVLDARETLEGWLALAECRVQESDPEGMFIGVDLSEDVAGSLAVAGRL